MNRTRTTIPIPRLAERLNAALLLAWLMIASPATAIAQPEPDDAPAPPASQTQAPAANGELDADDAAPPTATPSYKARRQGAFDGKPLASVGDLYLGDLDAFDPTQHFELELRVSEWGAGIESATLSRHFASVEAAVDARRAAAQGQGTREGHFVVQDGVDGVTLSPNATGGFRVRPFAAIGIEIDNAFVNLFGSSERGRLWRAENTDTGPTRFVADIVDIETDQPVARVVRTFELQPGDFHLTVRQRFVNLTDRPMRLRWVQEGPINLKEETSGYRLPLRRVRAGAVDDQLARRQQVERVRADGKLRTLEKVVREWGESVGGLTPIWPSGLWGDNFGSTLAWVAQTDRYFLAAPFALANNTTAPATNNNADTAIAGGSQLVRPPGPNNFDLGFGLALRIEPWVVYEDTTSVRTLDLDNPRRFARLILRTYSGVYNVPPNAELALDFGLYLGPLDDSSIDTQEHPPLAAVNLNDIIEYNLGGIAACCTFGWLGEGLLVVLRFFHSFTLDWAVSIVLLVVLVRTVLHPITKKSQVSLMRFGKQMQAIQPKQKKLQERYKDDPKKLRQEVQKLMREEGVNPGGAFGCLPMFLQTPIWIALYAMLYMVFDLRHQQGFYGLFQTATNGEWTFLADLSRGDYFIPFPQSWHFSIPLVGQLMGPITAFNIIPVLMGVLFFIQQKYMTPPPSAQMSPEMQTQQKLMKVMLVVMLPVFMYNAPAALTLYFMTNSTLGILESRYIRSHVDQIESDLEEHGVKTVRELKKRKQVANKARPLSESKRFKDRS